MLSIPYIGTIIYGWLAKDKKKIWIWCAVLYIIMIPLTSENYADYVNYSTAYNAIGRGEYSSLIGSEVSVGWIALNKLFYLLGFSYRGFVAIMILVCFYLLHKHVSCFILNENVFWSLFLTFPALIQCAQIRFFVGTMLAVSAFGYLVEERKYSIIKYIILVSVSSLVHSATLMLLMYLCIPIFERYSRKKAFLLTVILMLVTYLSLNNIGKLAALVVPSMRYSRYFGKYTESSPVSRFIYITIIWLISILVSYKLKNHIIRRKLIIKRGISNIERDKILNRYYFAIAITGITIPFLFIDASYHRFFEISYLFLYIIVSMAWRAKGPKNKKLLYILILSIVIFWMTRLYITKDSILDPFFTFQGIFSLFRWWG